MSKKLVRYKNVNGVLVKQFESPALVNGTIDISQLPVVGTMGAAIIETRRKCEREVHEICGRNNDLYLRNKFNRAGCCA